MKLRTATLLLATNAFLLAIAAAPSVARAQEAMPTATRSMELSAFGGVAGTYTGLSGGKNLGVVAGLDLGLPLVHTMRPTLEVRGLYPVDDGNIDAQKDILGGVRWDFLLNHRLQPYGDFLAGRGQMDYGKGYLYGNAVYLSTTTPVYSPGVGLNYSLSDHFSLKADAQFQRWAGAPTPGGVVWSKVGTVGLVYRFTFGPRHRY